MNFPKPRLLFACFSGDWVVSYAIGDNAVSDTVLQKDGKVVLFGKIHTGERDTDIGIIRFTSTGILDTGGIMLTNFGWNDDEDEEWSSRDEVYAAELTADGKMLLLGYGEKSGLLARFSMSTQTDAMIGPKATVMRGNNIYNGTGAG